MKVGANFTDEMHCVSKRRIKMGRGVKGYRYIYRDGDGEMWSVKVPDSTLSASFGADTVGRKVTIPQVLSWQ